MVNTNEMERSNYNFPLIPASSKSYRFRPDLCSPWCGFCANQDRVNRDQVSLSLIRIRSLINPQSLFTLRTKLDESKKKKPIPLKKKKSGTKCGQRAIHPVGDGGGE